jgi:hypothetical protein
LALFWGEFRWADGVDECALAELVWLEFRVDDAEEGFNGLV